ncbi:MAG TPA: competence/damage-inducible protein A [Bryobacteraceae bacterium]|nr:competence/damage-inducible protein A [Bryobacteraceae bacterium]
MNAEIIAVGSEMLTPERLDTNSLFLTAELNNLGIEVSAKHVVGDDRERLASEVRRAASAARFVIVSGGLGPTEDDVTRDAVAAALDRRQIFHAEIAEAIEARFRRMNRPMPEINKRQAMIVEGAHILSNDRGTAPGQWIEDGDSVVIILPGPPHELKSMFQQQCAPRLERIVPAMAIRTLVLRISGMSESDLDQTISPIYKRYENPVTTVLAHNGDLQVHLRARCESEGDAVNLLNEIGVQIEAALGDKIYSRNADPLEAVVGRKLLEQHATLATAESATGGGLADRISSIPGSSAYFLGGFVTYTARMKTDLLGVPEDLLKQFGPVSAETAEAMATGARRRTSATWAISITGNAGPTTDGDQAPVGSIYVGIAGPREVTVAHRIWPASDRPRVRAFAAQTALDLLNRKLV